MKFSASPITNGEIFTLYSTDIVRFKMSHFFLVIALVHYFEFCFILHSDSPFLVLFCATNVSILRINSVRQPCGT